VPLDVWFRGNLRELFADTLLSARSLQRGYFQAPFVRGLIREHLSARRDHTFRLWQLVVFERWLQQYVDAGRALPFLVPPVPVSVYRHASVPVRSGRSPQASCHPASSLTHPRNTSHPPV